MGSQSGNPRGILKYTKRQQRPALIIAVLAFLFSAFLFYWYEWRPRNIRRECVKEAIEYSSSIDTLKLDSLNKLVDFMYKNCVRKKGLSS